jgi:hypothetical protein
VRKIQARPTRSNFVAELRAALPIGLYLEVIHAAALTGQLPIFSYDPATKKSTPTGQFQALTAQQQLDILRYLVDKVVPAAPKEIDVAVTETKNVTAETIKSLTTEDLKRLVEPKVHAPALDPLE